MIKFFRYIRQKLIAENKFSKYLLYAIGEVILVVIGILIALQINNWNQQRIDIDKERRLLLEIQENLNEDLQNIDSILKFNALKLRTIDSAYYYLSKMNDNPGLGKEFSSFLPIITNHAFFSPNKVAFNNVTSTGNIDIFRSDDLRKKISRYYSNNTLDGVQDHLKITTQNFLNHVVPKMINKNLMRIITKRNFEVIPLDQIAVHKDPYVLSDLFVMLNKTKEHTKLLHQMNRKVESLKESIDFYLNKPH